MIPPLSHAYHVSHFARVRVTDPSPPPSHHLNSRSHSLTHLYLVSLFLRRVTYDKGRRGEKKRTMAPNANIPIIDIAAPGVDRTSIARQLVDAAVEHGFIYIRNTGKYINLGDIDAAFDLVTSSFFPVTKNPRLLTQVCGSRRSCSRPPWRRRPHAPSSKTIAAGPACTPRRWIPRTRE